VRGSERDERSRLRHWHALSGLLPIGLFLVEHLVVNAKALSGEAAFERTVTFVDRLPFWAVIEIVFVLAPLVFHAGYGVVLLLDKKSASDSPYTPNWRLVTRGAAWIALVFIAYHVYALRVPRWTSGVSASAMHTVLTAHLSGATGSASGVAMPWMAIFYLLGIAATILHFAAGTWGFLVRAKHVTTPSAIRRAAIASGALGAVLFALASITVISLASGAPVFPPPPPKEACPPPT